MAEKIGAEQLVNTTTSSNQALSSTTALSNSGFVVVWQDESATGGDTSSTAIRLQVFDSAGALVGSEVLVNTSTAGVQRTPSVARLGDGFMVVWEDDPESVGLAGEIRGQRFNNAGEKVGAELLINETTSGRQHEPVLSATGTTGLIVTWRQDNGGDVRNDLKGRLIDFAGEFRTGEFDINATTASEQDDQASAPYGNGAVVVWSDLSQSADDPSSGAIRGQFVRINGEPLGGEFLINTTTAGSQGRPTVAATPDGGFIVAWVSIDVGVFSILGQRYDMTGAKSGGELTLVPGASTGNVGGPRIEAAGDGFVLVYVEEGREGADTSFQGVYMRQFNGSGAQVGDVLLVNTTTFRTQNAPSVDVLTSGEVIVAWTDFSNGPDVRAQRVALAPGVIEGTEGSDSLSGGSGKDRFDGKGGDDTIGGGGGDDEVSGGAGDDLLGGGVGEDVLNGGEGADHLYGEEDDDTLNGGAGKDLLVGLSGDDDLDGGDDADLLGGAAGNDRLSGGGGNDALWAGDDDDDLSGGAGMDELQGEAGDDALIGGAGQDKLGGGEGRDYLSGGEGNDQLDGGAGADTLVGDAGADVFTWTAATHSAYEAYDIVLGFESGIDELDFTLLRTGAADVLRRDVYGDVTVVTIDQGGDGSVEFFLQVNGPVADGDYKF